MKCSKCSLVNFKTDAICKRCGASLNDAESISPSIASGPWRDSGFLVLGENAGLPRRCMKCNSDDNVANKVIGIGYYPKYTLALLLFGFIHYKTYHVGISMCQQHISNRGKTIIIYTLMIIAGVVSFIFGFNSYSAFFLIFGIILFSVGCILITIGGNPFAIEKAENSRVWLKGVNEDFLVSLPPLRNT